MCGSAVTSRASAPRTGVRFRPDPRIIGGTVAQATDWPWMVRLTFTTSIGFCAGVLVDDDTVVTVAHCVAGYVRACVRRPSIYVMSSYVRRRSIASCLRACVIDPLRHVYISALSIHYVMFSCVRIDPLRHVYVHASSVHYVMSTAASPFS